MFYLKCVIGIENSNGLYPMENQELVYAVCIPAMGMLASDELWVY